MTPYEFGEILLMSSFFYSDGSGFKKRPALVLVDHGDQDILVARVTSEEPRSDEDMPILRWKESGLLLPSTARLSKMASLSKSLVVKKLGRLGSPERRKIRSHLRKMFGL